MGSEITFANTTLSEAISRAARIAPTKGAAFDKAAGIFIDVSPSARKATIRSTNLEVTYRHDITALSGSGNDVQWRVPSYLIDGLMQSLGQGETDTTTLIDRNDDKIRLKSGRTVTALQLLDVNTFPSEEKIPSFQGIPADELASKVDRVAWAADPKSTKLSGVMVDGRRIVACNNYSVAVMECVVAVQQQIVAPLETMRSILRSASDVRMATEGKKLYVSIDETAVCSTTLIQEEYPHIDNLLRTNFLGSMRIHRAMFTDCMARINTIAKQERLPKITLQLDTSGFMKMLTLDVEVTGVARIRDEMDVTTDFEGNFTISFIPAMIEKAIENAQGELVLMEFGVEGDPNKVHSVRISDDKGYQCYVMPKIK